MRVAIGSDEDAPLVHALVAHLLVLGHEPVLVDLGGQWPRVGRGVAAAVACGAAERGVVCCWTGTGVAMAANKLAGVRAALCGDAVTAAGARRWNDANVLALSIRTTTVALGEEILDAFFQTAVDPDEAARIAEVEVEVEAEVDEG